MCPHCIVAGILAFFLGFTSVRYIYYWFKDKFNRREEDLKPCCERPCCNERVESKMIITYGNGKKYDVELKDGQ